jgi:hypothetical protein
MKSPKLIKITKEQREVLFGILLGDAYAEYSPNGKSVRLKIEQSEKHRAYVNHLHDVFSSWNLSDVVERRGNCLFSTPFSPTLFFYGNQFYGAPSQPKPSKDTLFTVQELIRWFPSIGLHVLLRRQA